MAKEENEQKFHSFPNASIEEDSWKTIGQSTGSPQDFKTNILGKKKSAFFWVLVLGVKITCWSIQSMSSKLDLLVNKGLHINKNIH